MDKEKKNPLSEAARDVATEPIAQLPKERTQFRALLAGNPNYFGNLPASPLPPVNPMQGNTTFEELGCVGFHPQSHRLDAVVYVKQPFGYGGDICSKGSQECVRFYLSYDNGATWVDLGTASFTAYDVPAATTGERRLEYAVGVPCTPLEKLCVFSNVLRARAILSWDQCPPPNQPNWTPVWGEVHSTHIQVQPRKLIPWFELFNEFKVKLPPQVAPLLDLDKPAQIKEPVDLSLAQLHALYQDKGVEPHRYAAPVVQKLLAQPIFEGDFAMLPAKGLFAELGLKADDVIGPILNPGDGNTFYEELECVGFNPVTSELDAVLRVKRPNGYSGGLCTNGSREYVTFWADLDGNGTFGTCLGTGSVQVFDISNIPTDGLEYTVFLPVNFGAYKRVCQQGPRLIPIRAILSWNSPAPCAFPNKAPVWGNREDTLILLPPGNPTVPGDFKPVLYNISTIAVCDIDQTTGLTTLGDRPFGGAVYIVGDIPGANSLPGPDRIKYRLFVRELPPFPQPLGSWQPIANDFGVTIEQHLGVLTQFPFTQQVDMAGYYTYRDYGIGSGTWRRVVAPYVGLLGVWNTAKPLIGRWEIRVEALDTMTATTYIADVTHCPDASVRQNVIIGLDEDPPTPAITITDFSTDGGVTWHAAIPCGDFIPGVLIRGSYSVSDAHFGGLTLSVEPPGPAHGATPTPASRVYGPPDFVPTTGESGTWVLNTAGMDPCGYVVRIDAGDRTVVSADGGWSNHDTVGFCLKAES
jgi:hypothetical protein